MNLVIDIETTGLDPYKHEILCIGIISEGVEHYILPDDFKWKTWFVSGVTIIGHNIKFDMKFLIVKYNIPEKDYLLFNYGDTEIMSRLIDENGLHSLKDLSKIILKYSDKNYNSMKEKRKILTKEMEGLSNYVLQDCRNTSKLFDIFSELITKDYKEIYEIEMGAFPYIMQMELVGHKIGMPLLDKKIDEFIKYLEEEKLKIDRFFEDEISLLSIDNAEEAKILVECVFNKKGIYSFNFLSTKQLGIYLRYKKIELPITEKGTYRVDKNILETIDIPIIKNILEYKKNSKLLNTYFYGIRDNLYKERVRCNFRQIEAVTGRMSCSNPNLQNQPRDDKRVREMFIPKKDNNLVYFDYCSQEMRIFAHYTNDIEYVRLIEERDIHAETANMIGLDKEKDRGVGKTINFAILYGAGAKKIAEQLEIKENDAKKLLELYYNAFPCCKKLRNEIERVVNSRGYIKTFFGRRRHLLKEEGYKALNSLIQGGCADIIKISIRRVGGYLKDNNLKSRIVLVIHDEIVLEIPDEEMHIIQDIKNIMEDFKFRIKLPVEVNYTDKNWAEKGEYYAY